MNDDKESRRNYDKKLMLDVMSQAKFRIAMSSFSEVVGAGILAYSINQMSADSNNLETYIFAGAGPALMLYSGVRMARAIKRYKRAKKRYDVLDKLDDSKGDGFHP